jgi:hypothetical protein
MNTFMTKHTVVLKRITSDEKGIQVFESDDDIDYILREKHKMRSDVWKEMGSPETITVTVEPGDLLNTEE